MTRRYAPGTGSSGGARLTPSPTPQGPRAGIQVVAARKPRVGPSAAEEVDGTVAPIDLRAEAGVAEPTHDSTLSNGLRQHVVNHFEGLTVEQAFQCCFCGKGGQDDLLIPGIAGTVPDGRSPQVCAACIERLIDALRAELPRRRLRLAMERLAAGTVSIEMVEAVERLAAGAQESTDG